MEYNTQREQLKIMDYGRNVAKMVSVACGIEDRAERTQMAQMIVEVMAHVNPQIKERADYRHILWDHLMLMADYNLDVDTPYEVRQEGRVEWKGERVAYRNGGIRYKHYGRALEEMIKAVADMPESAERQVLVEQIAHTMKRQYLQWNRDTVDNQVIIDQLRELSEGKLQLPQDFGFHDAKYYADMGSAPNVKKEGGTAKKRKKKKK